MSSIYEPLLAQCAAALCGPNSGQSPLTIVLTSTDAEAQEAADVLEGLCQDWKGSVVFVPSLVQTGVYRFESARRAISKRLGAFWKLHNAQRAVVVTSAVALARVSPTTEWMQSATITLTAGQEAEPEGVTDALHNSLYTRVQRVEEVGEYALRGFILDVWPMGEAHPIRCEFFGDTLEKIRVFRAADQRSFGLKDAISILPAREFSWPNRLTMATHIEQFNKALLQQNLRGGARVELMEYLKERVTFPGIDDTHILFSLNPCPSLLEFLEKKFGPHADIYCPVASEKINKTLVELEDFYKNAMEGAFGKGYAVAPYETLYPASHLLREKLATSPLEIHTAENCPLKIPSEWGPELRSGEGRKLVGRAELLNNFLTKKRIQGFAVVVRHADNFQEIAGILGKYFPDFIAVEPSFVPAPLTAALLDAAEIPGKLQRNGRVHALTGHLDGLVWLPASQKLLVSESWLRGINRHARLEDYSSGQTRNNAETLMSLQFGEFSDGDLVVHVQHGLARFRGLLTIDTGDTTGDFLVLEYAGNDKIYVPVHKMNLVQKYVGAQGKDASPDSLKGTHWEKRKQKAREDAMKLAKELMEHQAKRLSVHGYSFSKLGEDFLAFEDAFPYDATPDQERAVAEIMADMGQSKAMERLLCGDVGFGKTEVAMRAAYRAVLDGKQVAWLVPTTVLAHQHHRSILERMGSFGVTVALLDRSVGSKKEKDMLDSVQQGQVDIVVGTHRLLSPDVVWKDLGLLVVDEEHRFGVLQKEKIKNMSYGIDVLTMTATPIPRTLQMALLGLRDLSLLTTPPKARLSVKTFVCPFEEDLIRTALNDEFSRGGQVFYVHNRVEDLSGVQEFLKNLVPQAKIAVGHGKMSQKELDKIIIDFLDQKYNLLLCTTIIESGIDMPNVNTILVQEADHFGLAQLYQLRGRVGRRSSRGYAWFLTSQQAQPEDEGMKRLDILREHQELGSGFVIASQDLELRGAGNILGDSQSGHVADVGIETYTQMLDEALQSLGGKKVRPQREVEIHLPISGQIPDDYIANAKERLRMYRKFFGTRNEEALQVLLQECSDRFGPQPEGVITLAEVARLRRLLLAIHAVSLIVGDEHTEIRLEKELLQGRHDDEEEKLLSKILQVTNKFSTKIRLTPDGRLLFAVRRHHFLDHHKTFALSELRKYLSLMAGESLIP